MAEPPRCPRDAFQLDRRSVEPGVFWVCPHCRGMWISGDQLSVFLEGEGDPWNLPLDPPPPSHRPHLHDEPSCLCEVGSTMSAVTKSGVTVDVCSSCAGIWFDGGELATLIRKHRPDLRAPSGPHEDPLPRVLDILILFLLSGD